MESPPGSVSSAEENGGRDRPSRAWAWPAILLAPVLMLAGERYLPSAESEVEAQADLSQLAMLQVQAKFVIVLDTAQPTDARKQLAELERYARSDEVVAALAVTHGFLGLDNGGREAIDLLLAKRRESPGAEASFLEAIRRATLNGVDEPSREVLSHRIGWFASLLGTEGDPENVPGEAEIRNSSMVQLIMFGLAGGLVLLSILAGAALLLLAVIARSQDRLELAFDAQKPPARVFLEVFAIFLGSMAIGNAAGWFFHWELQPVISLAGVVLALFWPKLRGLPWSDVRRAMGLHRGRGWVRELGAGVVGYLVILPMAVIGMAASYFLVVVVRVIQGLMEGGSVVVDPTGAGSVVAEPVTHPAVGWLLGGLGAKVLVFLLAAVFAPLMEEIFFRGAFFRSLRTRWGLAGAGLINGFIFASLHPQGWMAIPALTAMGFGFACLREWRDSLIAPITAHAINNGLLIGGLALILR